MRDFAEYKISCNGAAVKRVKKDVHYLELEYREESKRKNVNIKLNDFAANVFRIEDRYKDLLEIAGYIFAADRKTFRGANDAVERHRWSRAFNYHIKVRDYQFWNKPDVQNMLSEALCFMTGDHKYEFTFQKAEPDFPSSIFDNEKFIIEKPEELSIVLFSGGVDSLAGVIEEIEATDKKICLISHQSGQPGVTRTQNKLFEAIDRLYPERCNHYKFHCSLSHTKSVDETQRSRAFLYTSIAFAIAITYNQNYMNVYENGITSINFPKTQDLMNGRASRTTHPKTLGLLERLFSMISEKPFKINHPYLLKTKTDVVNVIKEYNRLELLDSSVSCSRTRNHPTGFTHCGACSQCIDRIFAVFAAGAQKIDDSGIYAHRFFRDTLTDEKVIKPIVDYMGLAQGFATENIDSFYINKGSEIIEIEPYIKGDTEGERVEKIFNLCQRHSKQIEYAVEKMREKYDKPLAKSNPKSFYNLILGPRVYQKSGKQFYESEKEQKVENLTGLNKRDKISADKLVKLYIQTCSKLKITEPTLDQLFDYTDIQKSVWDKYLKKSSFWHLMKDQVEHSINQAKTPAKKDFWIEVKLVAEKRFVDLTVKEYQRKEKSIEDLPGKRKRSL